MRSWMKGYRAVSLGCVLAALVTLPACAAPASASGESQVIVDASGRDLAWPAFDSEVVRLVERYAIDRADLLRFHAVSISPRRFDRLDQLNEAWAARVDSIDPAELSPAARVDLILLRSFIARDRERTGHDRLRQEEIAELLPFAPKLLELEMRRWDLEPVDARAAAEILHAAAERVHETHEALREAIKKGNGVDDAESAEGASLVTPVLALRAAQSINVLQRAISNWFTANDGYKPEFSWWTRAPFAVLTERMQAYGRFLREDIAGQRGGPDDPLVGDPLGRAMIDRELVFEFVPYSAEELIAIGERELAWCIERMGEAAVRMGQPDWRAALEEVKTRHVPPGEQDAFVAQQAREAIEFVESRNLVTVPDLCRELWRIEMLSAERQRILPFAAYGGQHMLVAYPTDAMDHVRKTESMRGNNRHFTRLVTQHELIPGHHLQLFHEARYAVHRRLFRTPFFLEGWALHWEMYLWDLGFAQSPEDEIGMLFWRAHRCARIIVSLRFHLGEMTPPEMIDFLVERVGHERDGATSEVRRYVSDLYGPLYQVAYMIGGLQVRALHREAVGSGRMTDQAFHDAVLRRGNMPVELLRADLLEIELPLDHQASWRFDEQSLTLPLRRGAR